MIFILDEAKVLHVSNSETELQGVFEGVDVEEGVYRFFDESGKPLVAEFTVPNQGGKIFGPVRWVCSGTYRLLPSSNTSLAHLSELLSTVTVVEPNRYFSDLEAVRKSLGP